MISLESLIWGGIAAVGECENANCKAECLAVEGSATDILCGHIGRYGATRGIASIDLQLIGFFCLPSQSCSLSDISIKQAEKKNRTYVHDICFRDLTQLYHWHVCTCAWVHFLKCVVEWWVWWHGDVMGITHGVVELRLLKGYCDAMGESAIVQATLFDSSVLGFVELQNPVRYFPEAY